MGIDVKYVITILVSIVGLLLLIWKLVTRILKTLAEHAKTKIDLTASAKALIDGAAADAKRAKDEALAAKAACEQSKSDMAVQFEAEKRRMHEEFDAEKRAMRAEFNTEKREMRDEFDAWMQQHADKLRSRDDATYDLLEELQTTASPVLATNPVVRDVIDDKVVAMKRAMYT